jgi:hypothetical protein
MVTAMRLLRWLGIALGALVATFVALVIGIGVLARFSDGPIGPFPGGPLLAGSLVSERDVDWSFLEEGEGTVEFQLVEPPRSRTVGTLVHEGQLYVPCDLGFFWRRAPFPVRGMLFVMSVFKRWHEEALRDGRVVLRTDGKRYERQAVRVTDPELFATLSSQMQAGAAEAFQEPAERWNLPPDPDAIWFFRMDPRPGHAGPK